VCDGTSVYAIDMAGNAEDITPVAASPSRFISFCNHNGVLVFNSLAAGPHYWPGPTNVLTPLPGWQAGWKCEAIASYKYYLIALAMHESGERYEHKIRWSTSSAEGTIPGVWVPALDNEAGDDLLGETSGEIIGAHLVQDALWILKSDAIYALSHIGLPFVLTTRRLRGVFDIATRGAAVEYKGALILISGKEVYIYDGASVQSLVNGKVRDALTAAFGSFGFDRGKLFLDADNRYLWVLTYPSGAQQHRGALVLELESMTWGHCQLDDSYGLENVVFQTASSEFTPEVLSFHGSAGAWKASVLKGDGTAGGTNTCWIERISLPALGAPFQAMTTEAWLEAAGSATFSISFTSSEVPSGPRKTDGPYTINTAVNSSVHPRITGRYAGYRIETGSTGNWEIDSLILRQEPAGEH
jgi:hypothetical protein